MSLEWLTEISVKTFELGLRRRIRLSVYVKRGISFHESCNRPGERLTASCLGAEFLDVYASVPAESQKGRDVVLHWAKKLEVKKAWWLKHQKRIGILRDRKGERELKKWRSERREREEVGEMGRKVEGLLWSA